MEPLVMIEIMDELWKVATPVTSLIVKHLSGNKIGYRVATDWLQRLFLTVPTGFF